MIKRKDLKVVFLSDWLDNPYKKLLMSHLNVRGVEVKECRPEVVFILGRAFFLPLVFRQGKSDILHLHTLHSFIASNNKLYRVFKVILFIIQISILNLFGTKLVWTVHEWHDKMNDGRDNISPLQAAVIGRFFHAVITHSQTTQNEIIAAFHLNKDKVFVVPHGNYIGTYENEISQVEARKILNIPSDSLVFLVFGGIYRYKGVLEAIDAFKQLNQQGIYLLISGLSYEKELEETILDRIKGYENILFVHQLIPNNEIQIYLNACDTLLVPYKVFTTSGVAILGMSYGRACIAPNIGFFNDVFDEHGSFLYNSNDEYGLLRGMKSAIEKRDKLLEMGRYNLAIAQKWNWNYISDQTLTIYQRS